MCGICGAVTASPDPAGADITERMTAALAHRGPDSSGVCDGGHATLGAARLGIIDLPGSAQPLTTADRGLVLVANAEIYNHAALRDRLTRAGHRFRSAGDCEVILHLYEEHGDDLVRHLRGMFAFALWDARRRRLLLARDRMGEKPLYLHESGSSLRFASEMKALVASGAVSGELDPDAVNLYFHYQYVPEPRTVLRGVRKLPAAHLLTVETAPWRVRERRYWSLTGAPPLRAEPGPAIAAQLEALAPLVLGADVPVGVALSGGIDSSLVAALAARHAPRPVQAISVGYHGRPGNDERADARDLASRLGLEFHEVELGSADAVAGFPELVAAWDDPIADMTGFCYHAVARTARRHGIRVLLQGQGGDELFWGYPWVRRALRDSAARLGLTRSGRPGLRLRRAPEPRWFRRGPRGALTFYDLDPDYRAARRRMPGWYGPALRDVDVRHGPASLFTLPADELPRTGDDLAVEITRLIVGTYLRENGIAQGDRLTMANSVELRLPLVDHQVVETVIGLRRAGVPESATPKQWLREAAAGLLPPEVIARPKRPFSPPLRAWHAALVEAYAPGLHDGELTRRGVLTAAGARRLARGDFPAGAGSTLAFKALVLETWCRTVARPPAARVRAPERVRFTCE